MSKYKTISVIATGVLYFSQELIRELSEFDEIISLTYTYDNYRKFPLPIPISHHNGENFFY